MRKLIKWVIMGIGLFFLITIVLGLIFDKNGFKRIKKDRIAIIYIDGVIMGGKSKKSPFGYSITGSDEILENLKKAQKDERVKAIVLRVNSPGGSVASAQEIFDEIKNCKKAGKKVIASFSDLATSGAYYAVLPSDLIIANPGTITGSIGVILELGNLKELLDKIGIGIDVVKSGKYKDIGHLSRSLSPDERKMLQGLLDDVHNQFINSVAQERDLDLDFVKNLSDGRIFTGKQAHNLKLVDKLGNFQYAIKKAKDISGIKEADIIEYKKKETLYDRIFGTISLFLNSYFFNRMDFNRRDLVIR